MNIIVLPGVFCSWRLFYFCQILFLKIDFVSQTPCAHVLKWHVASNSPYGRLWDRAQWRCCWHCVSWESMYEQTLQCNRVTNIKKKKSILWRSHLHCLVLLGSPIPYIFCSNWTNSSCITYIQHSSLKCSIHVLWFYRVFFFFSSLRVCVFLTFLREFILFYFARILLWMRLS